VVIVKCFLHISKHEQKRRFDALRESAATAWRVTEADLRQHQRYAEYLVAAEDMLTETDTEYAPWTVVEAHDRRFATLKTFATVIDALERGVAAAGRKADEPPGPPAQTDPAMNALKTTALDHVDLSLSLTAEEYDGRLKKAQTKLRELEHQIYRRRVPVIIAYEGWDAAGKGGNIRRLTQNLDPRGYEVVPIAAPNDIDRGALVAALDGIAPTHVFFCSWLRQPTEAENVAVNGEMIENLFAAALRNKPLQHAALVTGTKYYLGPFESYGQTAAETPFRENTPRLPGLNFYYTLEDVLFRESAARGFA
jgi:polyphosphate kinase 2 (PPK2 family)